MALAPTTASASSAADPALLPTGVFADKPPLPLNRPATLVGARVGCHLRLVSADISQFHAVIVRGQDGVYVRDLASRSHSFVNGAPVREHDIRDGDRVQFGRFSFAFRAGSGVFVPQQPVPAATLQLAGGKAVPIRGRALLIGRRITADIVLTHESISNAHAIIFTLNGTRFIRDLASRTGTYVNGSLIHQQELQFGDSIRIGNAVITYVAAAAPVSADGAGDAEPRPHTVRPPTPSMRAPPFGMAARAGLTRTAPAAPPAARPEIAPEPHEIEPPVVAASTAPGVGDGEAPLPMVSESEIATRSEPIPIDDEPLAIARPATPRPMPHAPVAQPPSEADLAPIPMDDLPIAIEPAVGGEAEPPSVSDIEPPVVSDVEPVALSDAEPAGEPSEPIAASIADEIPRADEPVIGSDAPAPPVESVEELPLADQPPAVSDIEPPAASDIEPPVVSDVEPTAGGDAEPAVEPIEPIAANIPDEIALADEPVIGSQAPAPPMESAEEPPLADEPPVVSDVEPPVVNDVEPAVEPIEPIAANIPDEIVLADEPVIGSQAPAPPMESAEEPPLADEPPVVSDVEPAVVSEVEPPVTDHAEPTEAIAADSAGDFDAGDEISLDVEPEAMPESTPASPIESADTAATANLDIDADSSTDAVTSPMSDDEVAGLLAGTEPFDGESPAVSTVEPVEPVVSQTPPGDGGSITATAPLEAESAFVTTDQTASIQLPANAPLPTLNAGSQEPPEPATGGELQPAREPEPVDESPEPAAGSVDFGFARRPAKAARPAEDAADPFPAIDLSRFSSDAAGEFHDHDWDADHLTTAAAQPPSKPLLDLPPDLGAPLMSGVSPAAAISAVAVEPPALSAVEPPVVSAVEPPAVSAVEPVEFLAPAEPTPESAQALARDAEIGAAAPSELAPAPAAMSDELTDSLFGMAITNLTGSPPLVESSHVESPVASPAERPVASAAVPLVVSGAIPPVASPSTALGADPVEPPATAPAPAPPRRRAFAPLEPLSLDDGFFSPPARPVVAAPIANVAAAVAATAAAAAGATLPGQTSGGARISTVAPPSGGSVTVGPDVVIASPGAAPPAAQAPPVMAPPAAPAAASEFDPFGDYGGIAPTHLGGMPLNLPELAPPPAYFGKISVAFDGRNLAGERLPPTPLPPPKRTAPRRAATPPPIAPPAPPPPVARAPAPPTAAEEFVIGPPRDDGTPTARAPLPRPPVKKKERLKGRRPAAPKGRSNTPFSDESLRIRPQDLVSGATGGIMLPTASAAPPSLTGGLGTPGVDAMPVAERDAFSGEGPMRNNDAAFGGVPSNRRDEYVVPETDQSLARRGQEHDFAEDPFWDRVDEDVPPDLLAPTAPTVSIPTAVGPTADAIDPPFGPAPVIDPLAGTAPGSAAPRPAHAIDLPPAWDQQPPQSAPKPPAARRPRRWTKGMLVLAMLTAAAVAAGLVYLFVPQKSTVVGVLNYSNLDAFKSVPVQVRRDFHAAQLNLLAADATRTRAQSLAGSHETPDPGFLAASQKTSFVKAVQQAKWEDRDGGDESLVLTLTGTDARNDHVRMQALLLAMWAGNAQIHNNTVQLRQRITDLDKALSTDQQTLAQLTDKLPVLQATTRSSGGDGQALAAAADSCLAAWSVATALTDSDRLDLDSARRGALALVAPATQPANAISAPPPAVSNSPLPGAMASADNAIPATAAADAAAATTAPADVAMAATAPSDASRGDASAMIVPATAPASQPAVSSTEGPGPGIVEGSVADPQLVLLYAQLADARHDLQQARQARDAQMTAGVADVDAKVAAYQSELQTDKAVFDAVGVLTDFAAAAAKAVDGTALLQAELLSQHRQLQDNVDRMRRQQRRIAELVRLQVRKTDPDVQELNREMDVAQRLHDAARIEQIGRQIDDVQALADTEQGYGKADNDLSEACYDAARRFEAVRSMDMDAIDGQRRQFEASVPSVATFALNQELAQEQLRTAAENVIIARRELVRMMPGISTDISTQAVKVAELQEQIDDRWRALEDQAWRGMDDQGRLAVCRAVDGRRQQLIADGKAERLAQGDFWKAYAQWQEQNQAARSAQVAQQQLDELQRQIDQTNASIRTTSGERKQANDDLQQAIEPRQPDEQGRDVTVTPLDSRQWWYLGAVGAVVMCFVLAMFATGGSGRSGQARTTPPPPDALEGEQGGEFPDDPPQTPQRGAPRRSGRLTA